MNYQQKPSGGQKRRKTYLTKRRRYKRFMRKTITLLLAISAAAGVIGRYSVLALEDIDRHSEQAMTISIPKPAAETREDNPDLIRESWKGTPLEQAIEPCLIASKYYNVPQGAFVGIAYAESSFTKFPVGKYNPWGVSGNGETIKTYQNWEHACDSFGHLLRYYYLDAGLDTPEKIMPKYVGWHAPHWITNVKRYWN